MIPAKFRVWDEVIGQMFYDVGITPDGVPYRVSERRFDYYPPEFLMQYSGLKDKNGTLIYDGDIIRYVKPGEYIPTRDSGGGIIDYNYVEPEKKILYVEYFAATFATKDIKKSKTSDQFYSPLDWFIENEPIDVIKNVEVIGNIYETPDLKEE